MKIAIIGAGFTGLAAAHTLIKKGHSVTVFERDQQPGGLAIGYQEKEWDWTLEAFYHHWFLSDTTVLDLARELSYPVVIRRPKTSHLIDGKIYQLDSPMTLLTFKKLSVVQRVQMGLVLSLFRFNPFWRPLERFSATAFLSRTIGDKAYKIFWEPLLVGKFGKHANEISLAWFWARIAKRTTKLAYPKGGFLQFAKRLSEEVIKNGGVINYNASIMSITQKEGKVSLGSNGVFDKVLVTLPAGAFLKLAPSLSQSYRDKLGKLQGLGAVVLILRLREKLLKDNTYWLSICDTKAPVLAVVEHTNFMDSKNYNNEHLVYLGHYLPVGHPYFAMSDKELLKTLDPFIKKLNPDYKKSLIGIKKFSVPFAQPIIQINYSRIIPSFRTPMDRVFLANMQQVYPWDRGTNYAAELGIKVANLMSEE